MPYGVKNMKQNVLKSVKMFDIIELLIYFLLTDILCRCTVTWWSNNPVLISTTRLMSTALNRLICCIQDNLTARLHSFKVRHQDSPVFTLLI